MSVFFTPQDSWLADVIPFFWEGKYHLFYLRDWRDAGKYGEGTPWWHLVTSDFVHFEDWGEALPRGSQDQQDRWVFTGCVIHHAGTFHIFYTGHNAHWFSATDESRPQQAIMHATSPDLRHWTKIPEDTFFSPGGSLEMHDWRDPFVYWDQSHKHWNMLLAARERTGPSARRGLTARMTSSDLKKWTPAAHFWAPQQYYTHECPDLFCMGNWWYLIFSEFSDSGQTRYRMSRTPDGPWISPTEAEGGDVLDTPLYYAAKSASDGSRRYLFGWLASRTKCCDTAWKDWGGTLVVHELHQRPDGTLAVRAPDTVLAQFKQSVPLALAPLLGDWKQTDATITCHAENRYSLAFLGHLPSTARIDATITLGKGATAAGLLLHADDNADAYYELRLELQRQRIVQERRYGATQTALLLERPMCLEADQPVHLQVIVEGTCMVAYINGHIAFSARTYQLQGRHLGLFVKEGTARFRDLQLLAGKKEIVGRHAPAPSVVYHSDDHATVGCGKGL